MNSFSGNVLFYSRYFLKLIIPMLDVKPHLMFKTVSNLKVRTLNTFYKSLKEVNKTNVILPREFEAREYLYCKEHICLVIKMLELAYLFRKLILKWYSVNHRTSSFAIQLYTPLIL